MHETEADAPAQGTHERLHANICDTNTGEEPTETTAEKYYRGITCSWTHYASTEMYKMPLMVSIFTATTDSRGVKHRTGGQPGPLENHKEGIDFCTVFS